MGSTKKMIATTAIFIGFILIVTWHTHFILVRTDLHDNSNGNILIFDRIERTSTSTTKEEEEVPNAQHDGSPLLPSNLAGKFIRYALVKGLAYNFTHDPGKTFCRKETNRKSMPILQQNGVADFNVQMKTNLNIIYLGDGVGLQFSQALQEAANATDIQVVRYDSGGVRKISHVAKLSGGGTIAGLQVTGWFREYGKNYIDGLMPHDGGGFMETDVSELKRLVYKWHITTAEHGGSDPDAIVPFERFCDKIEGEKKDSAPSGMLNDSCTEQSFDAAVHQLSTEWIHRESIMGGSAFLDEFTLEAIEESVQLTMDQFGVKIIILQTIPIISNIRNVQELIIANQRIWKFAKRFRQQQENQKEDERVTLLIMEVGALSTSLTLFNSIAMGTVSKENASDLIQMHSQAVPSSPVPDGSLSFQFDNEQFVKATMKAMEGPLQKRMKVQLWSNVSKISSHSCGEYMDEKAATSSFRCKMKNTFSIDGRQWCMDVMAGRINAAGACLLQCGLKYRRQGELELELELEVENGSLENCERDCNGLYMTLSSVSERSNDIY
jgi:hypothetical protein